MEPDDLSNHLLLDKKNPADISLYRVIILYLRGLSDENLYFYRFKLTWS